MPRITPSEKLAKLEEERAKINAEIQRVRVKEQKQNRKDDTRRKLLTGAMILYRMEMSSDQWPTGRLIDALDTFLTRNSDRALFGLPLKSNPDPDPPESEDNAEDNDHDDLDSWLLLKPKE